MLKNHAVEGDEDGIVANGHEEPGPEKKTVKRVYHILIALIVLVVVVTTVALAILLSPPHKGSVYRPNILIVIADDLGYNDLGYFNNEYNGGEIKTPYIDRLARESIQLRRHYTQPMCSPSRAAFFTGRYPFRYGMSGARAVYYGSRNGLNTSEVLLPQILQEVGYTTYLFGKWHLGFADWNMTPIKRGFDYFYGMYGGSSTYYTHMSYEGPRQSGYDLFEDTLNQTNEDGVDHKVVNDNGTFLEMLLTRRAVKILDQIADEKDRDHREPFFMVMSYTNPHAPIEPMERDVLQNAHVRNQKRRDMASMITSLDYGVGQITATLDRNKMLNDTIIVFFSDNGGQVVGLSGASYGSSNYPLRGAKMTLYEGGIRTPAFIRIPGFNKSLNGPYSKKPCTYEGLFHVSDWFPTLQSFAKAKWDHSVELDGIDHSEVFNDLITGRRGPKKEAPRNIVVADVDPVYDSAAILDEKFKLIIGNPTALAFDQVYPLITEESEGKGIVVNSTHYSVNGQELGKQIGLNSELIKRYENTSDTSLCMDFSCMSQTMRLYDLSVDLSEENDISERFTNIRDNLRDKLREITRESMARPVYFEDENSEALDNGIWRVWL